MYICLIFPYGVSCLDHKKLNKGDSLSYFHSESNFTWSKIGLTWFNWVHLMIIGQMTKKWCNIFPPSMQALGANRTTEVRCKNSITRHQRGSQRERNIGQTKALENKTLRRRFLQVRKVSFMSEYMCYKRQGEVQYAC